MNERRKDINYYCYLGITGGSIFCGYGRNILMTETLSYKEQVLGALLYLADRLKHPVQTKDICRELTIPQREIFKSLKRLKEEGRIWKSADNKGWILGQSK